MQAGGLQAGGLQPHGLVACSVPHGLRLVQSGGLQSHGLQSHGLVACSPMAWCSQVGGSLVVCSLMVCALAVCMSGDGVLAHYGQRTALVVCARLGVRG